MRPLVGPFPAERILQALTVLLLLVLGVYLVTFTQSQRIAGECQAEVNDEFRAALTTRIGGASAERVALRQVLVDALADPPDSARTRDSLARYLEVLDRADDERARTPLPTVGAGCS